MWQHISRGMWSHYHQCYTWKECANNLCYFFKRKSLVWFLYEFKLVWDNLYWIKVFKLCFAGTPECQSYRHPSRGSLWVFSADGSSVNCRTWRWSSAWCYHWGTAPSSTVESYLLYKTGYWFVYCYVFLYRFNYDSVKLENNISYHHTIWHIYVCTSRSSIRSWK